MINANTFGDRPGDSSLLTRSGGLIKGVKFRRFPGSLVNVPGNPALLRDIVGKGYTILKSRSGPEFESSPPDCHMVGLLSKASNLIISKTRTNDKIYSYLFHLLCAFALVSDKALV